MITIVIQFEGNENSLPTKTRIIHVEPGTAAVSLEHERLLQSDCELQTRCHCHLIEIHGHCELNGQLWMRLNFIFLGISKKYVVQKGNKFW